MKTNLLTVVRIPSARTRTGLQAAACLLGLGIAALALNPTSLVAQILAQRSVLLSWPEPPEEQIIVGADSVIGPWRPWPEPCFKRHGELCLAVPNTAMEQYFKLVPGIQFIDDFNAPQGPYTGKGSWEAVIFNQTDSNRWALTNVNGTLRIQTLGRPSDARLPLLPPGPQMNVSNFWAAVDIRHIASTTDSEVAIAARATGAPRDQWPGTHNGYIAGVHPNESGTNQARLSLWTGSWPPTWGDLFTFRPEKPYRLIFSGVGQRLSVELIDLELQQPAVTPLVVTNSTFSQGWFGVYIEAYDSTFDLILDNFFITGTKGGIGTVSGP